MSQTPRMFNALRQIVVSKRCVRISPPLEGRGCCTLGEHPEVWTRSFCVGCSSNCNRRLEFSNLKSSILKSQIFKSQFSILKSQIFNLKSQIFNLKSQISILKSQFSILLRRALIHQIYDAHIGDAGVRLQTYLTGAAVGIPHLDVVLLDLRAQLPESIAVHLGEGEATVAGEAATAHAFW